MATNSNDKLCVEKMSDLTEENLSKIFRFYFRDASVKVKILSGNEKFIGDLENYQSEIAKWTVRVWRGRDSDQPPADLSFIVKTSLGGGFAKFNSRITRQFFTETFWYKHALPELSAMFPEVRRLSPGWYYAWSNYEESFRPDWWDNNCGMFIRQLHHKNEEGILLMENVTAEKRPGGEPPLMNLDKTKILSKNQVVAALKSLAIFHGSWWVWLTRQRKQGLKEFEHIMNIRDVESAFMDMRSLEVGSLKWVFNPTLKSYVKLLKNQGKHEMAAKFKEYFAHKIWDTFQVLYSPADIKSDIKTMCHGDFWVNNMMFNSSDPEGTNLETTLVDYQQLTLTHPARDLWYFLYSSTDRKFREAHLDSVLRLYHEEVARYWAMEDFEMSYDKFLAEINQHKVVAIVFTALFINYIIFNPEQNKVLESFSNFQRYLKDFRSNMAAPPSENDHPNWVEIKKRTTETLCEIFDSNLL